MRLTAPPGRYPHGTRAKYTLEGCRCFPCRVASSNYEYARIHNLPATATRSDMQAALRHVRTLQAAGLGVRQIAKAAGIRRQTLREFLRPEIRPRSHHRPAHRRIRRSTVEKLLGVTVRDRADHACVPAARTWEHIDDLRRAGFSKAKIARLLGYRSPALQFRRHRVLVVTARKVRALHHRYLMHRLDRALQNAGA